MATKNQRIAAYVPENVYQKYQSFKAEKGLGDSQALIQILSEYFGVTHLVSRDESLQTLERIARLEASLSTMRSDLLSELKESVLKELAPQAVMLAIPPRRSEVEVIESVPEDLQAGETYDVSASVLPEIPPVAVSSGETQEFLPPQAAGGIRLSSGDLRNRLKASRSTMSRKSRATPDVFSRWSAERDPDKIPWVANADETFSPVGDIPLEVETILAECSIQGLSHGDLAKRLKIDASTLSHWKKKTADDMLNATREKDPDNIGWVLNDKTGRFTAEPSSSPRLVQSELLEIPLADNLCTSQVTVEYRTE
jgi:transposase-like protein